MPEIRRIDSGKIACISTRGAYSLLPSLFKELLEYLDLRRIPRREDRFAIIYDAPEHADAEKMHFAAGLELSGETLGNGEVIVVTRPAGWLACELHRGALEDLAQTRRRLSEWVASQGYRVAGPSYEYFISGPLPGESGDPAQIQVEIQFPVEKIGA